jgi:hypothetical protein
LIRFSVIDNGSPSGTAAMNSVIPPTRYLTQSSM